MKPAARALRFIKPYRLLFLMGQAATLGAAAAGLVFPLITRDVIDGLISDAGVGMLRNMVILAAAFPALALFTWLKERSLRSLSLRVTHDLRNRVFAKIQRLPYRFFDSNRSGDLISVITNDVNRFQDSVAAGLAFLISQSVSLLAVLAILFVMDATLTLTVLGFVPVFVLLLRIVSGRVRGLSRRVQDLLGEVTAIAGEAVRGVDVIKSYVLGSRATEIFTRKNREVLGVAETHVRWSAGSAAVSTLLGGAAIVALIGFGGLHVRRGVLSPGELVAYLMYAQMIVGPIGMLSGIVVEVQRALAAIERVFRILDVEEEGSLSSPDLDEPVSSHRRSVGPSPTTATTAPVIPTIDRGATIDIGNVSFSYGDAPVLSDFSLRIAPGEFVALVGPSGAGKSTLLKLLVRFYEVDAGRILIDGSDIRRRTPDELRREIALVMQETHLFDMSVADNVRCGRPDAELEAVIEATRAAEAQDFVEALPSSFESAIGENGTRLSGGQRQRLSLARAFLKAPRVLLLDEATSSLDTESERKVQQALSQLMAGRTTVAIAHRLSTVVHADRIVVMDQGRIVDVGSHDRLLDRNPLYESLCRRQMITTRAEEWRRKSH